MSELSWLIDLLLNHKLSPATKKHVSERIAIVEAMINTKPYVPFQGNIGTLVRSDNTVINGAQQSPSTLAAMARHGMVQEAPQMIQEPIIQAQGVVAATPATAQAMNARQQSIQMALSGKEEKGRTSPRKF